MTAVRIPPVLRAQAGDQKKVEVAGATVGEALGSLIEQFAARIDFPVAFAFNLAYRSDFAVADSDISS